MSYTRQLKADSLILAAIEPAPGVDPGLTGVHALKVSEPKLVKLEAQSIDLHYATGVHGAAASKKAGLHRSIEFSTYLFSKAGTAPPFDVLLRACKQGAQSISGLQTIQASPPTPGAPLPSGAWTYSRTTPYAGLWQRTVTVTCTTGGGSGVAVVSVTAPAVGGSVADGGVAAYTATGVVLTDATPLQLPAAAEITPTITAPLVAGDVWTLTLLPEQTCYAPLSSGMGTCSIYSFEGERLYKLGGCRGDIVANISGSALPTVTWKMIGSYAPVELGNLAAVRAAARAALAAWEDPLPVEPVNTHYAALHGVDLDYKTFDLTYSNKTKYRGLANYASIEQGNHEITAKFLFDQPPLAHLDYEALVTASTRGDFGLRHGKSQGQIVHIDSDVCQLAEVPTTDDDGVIQVDAALRFVPEGAAEIALRFI